MLIQIVDTPQPKRAPAESKYKMLIEALVTLPEGKSIMLDVSAIKAKDPTGTFYATARKKGLKVSIHWDKATSKLYIRRVDYAEGFKRTDSQ